MKKNIISIFVAISAMLLLLSATTQSSLPGFIHKFDPQSGILLTKAEYGVVVDNGNDTITIYYYDCPPGTEFSCDVIACVTIGSNDACECVVGQ